MIRKFGEKFEDYRERRKEANKKLKKRLKGHLVELGGIFKPRTVAGKGKVISEKERVRRRRKRRASYVSKRKNVLREI